ncbi:MAG TPA: nuclear transport factor 2 family protein [Pyrinomonadaceae bacterium]|nr:nuclear transport factor 2 family protein [Pyrinomonadaceae bacterium]
MKRLIAPAALLMLLAATACTTTTENANTGAGNANANASATATPAAAGPTQADIEARERQIWDALKAKNWDAFAGMLSDDFVNVGAEGVHTKAQTMEEIKKYDLTEYSFADIRFVKVDQDLAIITYTATEKSSFDGHAMPSKPTRATSAWVNKGGKWLAAYHQETEAGEMPATPGGANSNTAASANSNANTNANTSAANANANASASPAAAETANPIDREKKVWEEFKTKDWAAFATDLADEFIEVVPTGVYTKAASIDALKMMDASKYTLSDWKETKIDADASVVTYHVKSADGKDEGNHSTIWAKRGDRWWAFLHQGTPVMKK